VIVFRGVTPDRERILENYTVVLVNSRGAAYWLRPDPFYLATLSCNEISRRLTFASRTSWGPRSLHPVRRVRYCIQKASRSGTLYSLPSLEAVKS
jgi:hypothetical protein